MFNLKRFLLLGSIGVSLLAGLMFTTHTTVSSTAFANGCSTVAEDYIAFVNTDQPAWGNAPTCTVSDTENSNSNAVYGIQLLINDYGPNDPQTGNHCTVGRVDGSFGQNTFDGVECLQRGYNSFHSPQISVDGVVGPQTWAALSTFLDGGFISSGWMNFGSNNFRMWDQSSYKWYVNAGGCWRQMDVNSSACE